MLTPLGLTVRTWECEHGSIWIRPGHEPLLEPVQITCPHGCEMREVEAERRG